MEGSSSFTGYQIQYSTDADSFASAENIMIDNKQVYSKVVDNLKEETTYYVRIRSYYRLDGVLYYGGWSQKAAVAVTSYEE